jgi:lytic murein transglycosylase
MSLNLFSHMSTAAPAVAVQATSPSAASHNLTQCLAGLRRTAPENGISVQDFDHYTQGSRLLTTTITASRTQPEVKETWWDYIAKTVDTQRVNDGMAVLAKTRDILVSIDEQYRIDSEPLIAIFGIETNFGTKLGKVDVLNAWLTRACDERKPLWIKNFYASIQLLRDGMVTRSHFIGSWSGAFGMTQFIPTSFLAFAVDGDGDGCIDLYGSLADALASTANYLLKHQVRWTRGLPAVIEVRLPAALATAIPAQFETEYMNPSDQRTFEQWAAAGVVRADGSSLKSAVAGSFWESASAYQFAPTGAQGPIFLVTRNFDAIFRYNRSRKYALAVSLLSNRLKGEQGLITRWPTDDPGLSRGQVKALQTLLAARGYDINVPADGILGNKTQHAIVAEQQRLGLPQDGRIGTRVFDALQHSASH